MRKINSKTWNVFVISGFLLSLLLIGCMVGIIDPFLHYHGPLGNLQYPLKEERYVNDGISRHYDYDAVITGSSMTQNFSCSEFDELFQAKSLKVCYSAATFHELREHLEKNFEYHPGIKTVLCSLDVTQLNADPEQDSYEGYPDYLYDDSPWNDVNYVFNKEVITKAIAVLNYTRSGARTPTRDEFASWSQYKFYGREAVEASFTPLTPTQEEHLLSEEDRQRIRLNVTKNVAKLANAHPDTEFYYFFPPYSYYFWDALERTSQLRSVTETQKIACEILLHCPNVHVFDFSDKTEITTNLDNYTDTLHYGGWINSEILKWIAAGDGQLTPENYEKHLDERKLFQ